MKNIMLFYGFMILLCKKTCKILRSYRFRLRLIVTKKLIIVKSFDIHDALLKLIRMQ